MNLTKNILCLFLFFSLFHAEKAPMSPAALRKTATHVIVGKVLALYQRTEKIESWKYTRYLAEVQLSSCEKGEGLTKDQLVYVRYWTRSYIGLIPPPSTYGHRQLPRQGETLRIYLAQNAYDGFTNENKDGGFNVIGANGFERIKVSKKTTSTSTTAVAVVPIEKSLLESFVFSQKQLPAGCVIKKAKKEEFPIKAKANPYCSSDKAFLDSFAKLTFNGKIKTETLYQALFSVYEENKEFGVFGFQFYSTAQAKAACKFLPDGNANFYYFQQNSLVIVFWHDGVSETCLNGMQDLIKRTLAKK